MASRPVPGRRGFLAKVQAKRRSATARPVVAPQVASQPAPEAAQAGPAKPQAPHTPGPASAEAAPQQVQVVVVAEVDEGAPPRYLEPELTVVIRLSPARLLQVNSSREFQPVGKLIS